MNATIRNLANLIRVKQEDGTKFVVMLGAGASVGAGVPYMSQLMKKILADYHQGGDGDVSERFDRYWENADKNTRNSILREHLDAQPSEGHKSLARLIKDGHFDAVVTFNYDDLLEQALDDLGVEHEVRVRGELKDEVFAGYMLDEKQGPRVLKIHGSFKGAKIYLASLLEMGAYPREIAEAFKQLSKRDLLVCGYAFGDLCVARAFAEYDDKAGRIYCADPGGVSRDLKQLAMKRLISEQVIDDDAGKFDEFFPALEKALSDVPDDVPVDAGSPKYNPYKFIEGLYGDDRNMLIGRGGTLEKVVKVIETGECRFINLYGEKKSGKSSFLRAGVMPALREKGYETIYLRCLPSHDEELVGMLGGHPTLKVPITGLADAIGALDENKRERLVIVLDQFERVAKSYLEQHGEDPFIDVYEKLYLVSKSIACLVLASRDERTSTYTINTPVYIVKLIERHREDTNIVDGMVELRDLKGDDVAEVLSTLNGQAANVIPEDLQKKYTDRMSEDDDFTLAHAHALCHLFVSEYMRKGEAPGFDKRDVEIKLNLAINACDVMNLIDDLSLKEERILLRNLMKIVSPDSKERIATHVRDHLYHLLTKPGYTANAADRVVN